jgi:hypothetical protein
MALTQKDLDRILNSQGAVQRAFDANQPTVTAQRPSSPSLSGIANVLNAIRQPLDVYGLNKNIPVVGGMTAADVTGLNQVAPLTEDIAYGRPVMRGGSLQTMQPDPRLAGFLDFIPAAGLAAKGGQVAAKAGLKEVARQIETGTGAFGKGTIDPRMYAYLPDTPMSPNPLVGNRFVSESANNLVPETILPIEKLKGSSIVKTPYDNTNAGQIISEISGDIRLQNPVTTMGGDDFARLINNYNQNIGGASNYGIASRVGNRFDVARKENLAAGGTGEIYSAPVTMSQKEASEAFSTYPTEIGMQILNQQGNKKSIKEFNDWFKNSAVTINRNGKNVLVRPFNSFKGIETPEGQSQLFTGEGFGAGGTAGNARKNFFDGLSMTRFEKMFDYNMKDIRGAVNDPRFVNLPKGYVKGNLIKTFEDTALTPSSLGSKIKSYDTDIAGKYAGTINPTPIEILMPKTYERIFAEMADRYPKKTNTQLHNMTLGAMEKRKDKFSEVIDQQIIDNYYRFHEGLLGK